MKAKLLLFLVLPLLMATTSAPAETVADLPLHVKTLAPGVIRVWIGDHVSSTATVAVATEAGLVIIDTTGKPAVDRELRKVIARELGRDDFTTLINTHEHYDHTGGNGVYADCTIVGHELVAAAMTRNHENRQRIIDWRTSTRVTDLEKQIAELAAGAAELANLEERLIDQRQWQAAERADEPLVVPTLTFNDRLNLSFGDVDFELYYIGGMHSSSDIAIFIPQRGMLLTGDTMADAWLNETPGCLASFVARSGVRHDFPRLLANWNVLLDKQDELKVFVTGHWNGELSLAGFTERVKYVEALWEGVAEATAAEANLATVLSDFSLADRFPELVEAKGCSQGNNSTTIVEMWAQVAGQESGARALYQLIDSGAEQAAIDEIIAQYTAESPTHYFIESSINGGGYRFLQSEKPEQAVAMFRINIELFADSWNAYDSLGEALFAVGDHQAAIKMYEKSLKLNPESENGQKMLAEVHAATAVN